MKRKWVLSEKDLKKTPPTPDYRIPNFGLDKDIKDTITHTQQAEKRLGKWTITDVQTEDDVPGHLYGMTAMPEYIQLEESREPLLTWKAKAPASHPVDYFVPNFGVDSDIKNSLTHIANAEKSTGSKWGWTDPKDRPAGPPMNYFVPNFGVDEDVKNVLSQSEKAEKKLNTSWVVPKKEKKKKTDYTVPNFGMDQDIAATIASEQDAKKQVW